MTLSLIIDETIGQRTTNATRSATDQRQEILLKNPLYLDMLTMERMQPIKSNKNLRNTEDYELRIVGGRNEVEGRVEVKIEGIWGVICADRWTLLEARVACKQAGLGYASHVIKGNHFRGEGLKKLAAGIECDGKEDRLSDCHHQQFGQSTICKTNAKMVAGVICSFKLPDLVPNATLIQSSMYLQDLPLAHLQCAMEENCAAPEAFKIKAKERDWQLMRRRLLRFSAMTWNFGTSEFKPFSRKETWEWHLCHRHYHSMSNFAEYDIIDDLGNRVAHGHKASFCLEDNYCMEEVPKKYACAGFGDQGISIGCADVYMHDIDCQWIDVTEVPRGNYTFKMKVNPEYLVGELDYDNNAVFCNINYTGSRVFASNCKLSRG